MQSIEDILQQAKSAIASVADLKSLDEYRIHYLGKKGKITEVLKSLSELPVEDRPAAGQKVNNAKEAIKELIDQRDTELRKTLLQKQLISESIDVTLPGRNLGTGSIHPIIKTIAELRKIFIQMGFTFEEGPEIEDDYHNFAALNIPPLHPARAMQDTFYFPNGMLLRSHTSPVQIRAMKKMQPPLRMVAIGRVYRRDFDMTHTPMFHQIEVMMIEEDLSFAHLKGILKQFLEAFFERDVLMRLRPSYFPFTEPSAEVDISCLNCHGKGCRICKRTGWLEVLGCGMVHPNVLNMANIDSNRYCGFAAGVGIDRLTLLKYGVPDLRTLFENDIRFLKQF